MDVYTDGSKRHKSDILSSSIWIEQLNRGMTVVRHERDPTRCTNIRAELEAIVLASGYLSPFVPKFQILTDCNCLVMAWKGLSSGRKKYEDYAHPDLWQSYFNFLQRGEEVALSWVRGHAGIHGNVLVDRACNHFRAPGIYTWRVEDGGFHLISGVSPTQTGEGPSPCPAGTPEAAS